MQFTIPCLPLPFSVTMEDFADWMESAFERIEADTGQVVPIILFEPRDWPKHLPPPPVSTAPDAMIVVPIMPEIIAHCFRSLKEVEKREPQRERGIFNVKIKGNTPMKSIFRQMAAASVSVFSMSGKEDSTFFLRTHFTISEFLKEVAKPVETLPNN